MLSPLSLDLAAQDIVRDRLQQAARAALAAQLRASRSSAHPASAGVLAAILDPRHRLANGPRQRLANGLRTLARRLDPAIASCDPPLAVLKVR